MRRLSGAFSQVAVTLSVQHIAPCRNNHITMNKQQHQLKKRAREARQARQANRVINGIFIALILLMVLTLIAYYLLS